MTPHLSGDCPDFPCLHDDWHCPHNPPGGQPVTVPFIRTRGVIASDQRLWLATKTQGLWFPTAMPPYPWTVLAEDGRVLAVGEFYPGTAGVQT